jgi:hypothetical protein
MRKFYTKLLTLLLVLQGSVPLIAVSANNQTHESSQGWWKWGKGKALTYLQSLTDSAGSLYEQSSTVLDHLAKKVGLSHVGPQEALKNPLTTAGYATEVAAYYAQLKAAEAEKLYEEGKIDEARASKAAAEAASQVARRSLSTTLQIAGHNT